MKESLIKRTKRTKDFTIIGNDILTRTDMSFGAKGLLCYILSLPDDFVVYKSKLQKDFKLGRKMVNALFLEIEKAGYMHSVDQIRENGRFGAKHYFFYDISINSTDVLSATAVGATAVKVPLQRTNIEKELTNKKLIKLSKRKFFDFFGYDIDKTLTAVERKKNLQGAVGRAFSRIHKHIEDLDDLHERVNSFVRFYSETANSDKELMKFEEIQIMSGFDLDQRLYDWVMKYKTSDDYHDEYVNNL